MKSLGRASLALLVLSSVFAFAGCGDDDDGAPVGGAGTGQGGSGAEVDTVAQCKVLGELCHAADSGTGEAHECHELGHVGDGAACAEGFSACVNTCVEESDGKEPLCAALGELCHEVDDQTGPLHECHELGHVNDEAACAADFNHCASICLAAREALEQGEGGGGSGAGGEHSHAEAGASHGGASTGGAGGAP